MAKVTMKLDGMEALQRAIVAQPVRVKAYASDAVSASTFAIAQRMRATVPVRSGVLKSQITPIVGRASLSARIEIAPEAFYWRFVEYGTVRVGARPFIRPAADQESTTFIGRIRDIGEKLERDFATSRFA